MRATQARVGIVVALGLFVLAVAVVPTIDRASGELIPPLNVTREAADPSAGVDAVVAWHTAEDEGVRAYLEAVRDARIAQDAADDARAKDAAARANRGTRRTTGDVWAALAACESGGRWHLDARYDGGLQFDPPTWTAYKADDDPAFAWQASPDRQVAVAQRVLAAAGWGQWPRCARRLGLLG